MYFIILNLLTHRMRPFLVFYIVSFQTSPDALPESLYLLKLLTFGLLGFSYLQSGKFANLELMSDNINTYTF